MSSKRSRDKAERAYDAMLSRCLARGGRETAASATASGSAAHAALAVLRDVRRRERRGDVIDADYVARLTANERRRPVAAAKTSGHRLARGGGILCAAFVLLGIGGTVLSRTHGHSVSGTLEFRGRPLAGVELVFHPDDVAMSPVRAVTSDRGSFIVGGVPEGRYVISVSPPDEGSPVPKRYCERSSTPFSLEVHKDLSRIRMVIVASKQG